MTASEIPADDVAVLMEATARFYESQADSFSRSRSAPWSGWEHVASLAAADTTTPKRLTVPYRVLDVGCGNQRFERYLEAELPDAQLEFCLVDRCDTLTDRVLAGELYGPYRHLDIVAMLAEGGTLADELGDGGFDLGVCFGLMHHIPDPAWRKDLLGQLVACVRSGGLVAVSLWDFVHDARRAKTARRQSDDACACLGIAPLEGNDYVLGWRGLPGVHRYCHDFTPAEADELIGSVQAHANLVDRYRDDGPSGFSNTYLVFRRR